MADFPLTWPPADTWHADPPEDHYYASALWLCGRHPSLVQLVERVPGAVSHDDGSDWLELDVLADALAALDAHRAAWRDYEKHHPAPSSDDRYAAWEARGRQLIGYPPELRAAAESIDVMSRTEVSRLRLLAFFAGPVLLGVAYLGGFDDQGRRLLHDWTLAVVKA